MNPNRILLIDDSADIRESTAEILLLANYQVIQASNGKDGVDLAVSQLPDLILCDIMMPELDGFGVLYMLSKNPLVAGIPFIFLTARADRMDLRRGMEMGADDYLTKPFTEMELLQAVESRLKKKDRLHDIFQAAFHKLGKIGEGTGGIAEMQKMIASKKIRQIKKKQVVYYEGDTPAGIYMVLAGKIKTFKLNSDGRELLTALYEADDYFGIQSLLLNEDYHETAEAQEDSSVCLLPREQVDQVLLKHPDVSRQFLRLLANNLRDKEEQLIQLAYHSVRKRLAELLLRLKATGGEDATIFISRDDLAAMAGMATETVSRTLTDFKDERLIEKDRNQITIIDATRLANLKN